MWVRGIRGLSLRRLVLVAALTAGCGSGGGSGGAPEEGGVALRAVWQVSGVQPGVFEGSSDLPPTVRTVEVRVTSEGEAFRRLVDPLATRSVEVSGIPVGSVEVLVLGYDVPFGGPPDLSRLDIPPSYSSDPIGVLIEARRTKNLGQVNLFARSFVTELNPLPASTNVPPETRVSFVISNAVAGIDPTSVNVRVADRAEVVAGVTRDDAELTSCQDGTAVPCGGSNRGLRGVRFRASSEMLPGPSGVSVDLSAADPSGTEPVAFTYAFTTAELGPPPATATFAATPSRTATSTATRPPPPTSTNTTQPTETPTAAPTDTPTSTIPPTETPTVTSTVAPTDTATALATATSTATETALSTATATAATETPVLSPTETPFEATPTPTAEPTTPLTTETATEATPVPTSTPSPPGTIPTSSPTGTPATATEPAAVTETPATVGPTSTPTVAAESPTHTATPGLTGTPAATFTATPMP